jgi:DNA-directed RNA polymerase specialized sigma24 family protein
MSLRDLPWSELLVRLQAGPDDKGAWDAAWREASRRLEAYARVLIQPGRTLDGASAEDLVQQTLLKLLQAPSGLKQVDPALFPEGFFRAALRNAARDLARRKVVALRALRELGEMYARAHRVGVRPPAESPIDVEKLPPDERNLLRLRFWEDLPIGEIARRLGEPYSRVAVRLFRLLQRLKCPAPP